jgi:hypothetical protein
MPYVTTSLAQPETKTLLALARQHDLLEFENVQDPNACSRIGTTSQDVQAFYQRVEHALRKSECVGVACATLPPPQVAFPGEDYLLWSKHRIRPEHAEAIVRYFAEAFNDAGNRESCVPDYPTVQELGATIPGLSVEPFFTGVRPGALNVQGRVEVTGASTRFSADASLVQRGLGEVATQFTRYGPWRLPAPWEVRPFTNAELQGLADPCGLPDPSGSDQRRRMGVVSALTAARQAVGDSVTYLNLLNGFPEQQHLESYFKNAGGIIELINATIGDGAVAVKPVLDFVSPTFVRVENDSVAVEVNHPSTDTWWNSEANGGPAGVVHGVFAVARPAAGGTGSAYYPEFATNLALDPSTMIDVDPGPAFKAVTIANMAQEAFEQGHFAFAGSLDPGLQIDGMPPRWISQPLRLASWGLKPNGTEFGFEHLFTIVAVRWDPATPFDWDTLGYRLVASNMSFRGSPTSAQYFAVGGSLGEFAQKHAQALPNDPATPALDGYGLPTNWVPPLDAGLLGGTPGESSVPFYLSLAEESAKDAASAVEHAVQGLLAEAQDEAAKAAADVRALEAIKEARDRLCGIDNSNCNLGTSAANITLQPFAATCSNLTTAERINCFLSERIAQAAAVEVEVANAVLLTLPEPAAPGFGAYSGGTLQSAFIEQWSALKAPQQKADELIAVGKAAIGKVQAADIALQSYSQVVQQNCNEQTFNQVQRASCTKSTSTGASLGFPSGGSLSYSEGESCNPALVLQHKLKCEDLLANEPQTEQAVVVAGLDAWVGLSVAAGNLTDTIARVRQSGAIVSGLISEAKLSSRQVEVEAELASTVAPSSFGLSRRYRSYDVWRAKALLDGSRRYALTARRALEARYVVNLSRLEGQEPFVASPAGWADDVYAYDLNLLPAVGLSIGDPVPGGLHSTKVLDYVHNLQAFVAGFPIQRPSAVSEEDVDVVYLPGLAVTAQAPGDSQVGLWTFQCPGSSGWVPLPETGLAGEACAATSGPGINPARAAIEFSLDPWARRNKSTVDAPYLNRYNVRFGRLAVNLIGTGLKDCTKAADAYACYNEGFIRFNLSQGEGAVITDFDGIWQNLATPPGRIEGAKALAAELWLDPLKDGWSTQYVSAVARTEFNLRPVGGSYRLELELGPEVKLERLERVQLLIGTSYWAKQQ